MLRPWLLWLPVRSSLNETESEWASLFRPEQTIKGYSVSYRPANECAAFSSHNTLKSSKSAGKFEGLRFHSAMSTPLLFLDFDGVLHPGSGRPGSMFTQAGALENALEGFDIRIVVSSSWRFHYPTAKIFASLPEGLARRIIGTTGEAQIGRWARYQEVRNWLTLNEPTALTQSPTPWRALDDAKFEFPDNCAELIACEPREGFGPRQAEALRLWLGTLATGQAA